MAGDSFLRCPVVEAGRFAARLFLLAGWTTAGGRLGIAELFGGDFATFAKERRGEMVETGEELAEVLVEEFGRDLATLAKERRGETVGIEEEMVVMLVEEVEMWLLSLEVGE